MNTIAKEYCKNAKFFFPLYGKKEKAYLKELESAIEDYCEDNNIISLGQLYIAYGVPSDVARSYYATFETEHLIKKIYFRQGLKSLLIVLVATAFLTVGIFGTRLYQTYRNFKDNSVSSVETIIEEVY